VNDPPVISNIPDQSILGGASSGPIAFTVDDPDTARNALTVTSQSSNTVLVPLTGIALSGADRNRTVSITPAGAQGGSSVITLTVSDGQLAASDSFTVTVSVVVEMPRIISPPENLTVDEGGTATFAVGAGGTAPLAYQWQYNGQDIPGATAATFVVRSAQPANAGSYTVRVSNSAGSVVSPVATLVVQTLDFGDAPDGNLTPAYPTLLARDGARHVVVAGFSLGPSIDSAVTIKPVLLMKTASSS
jgi:hypothetical protein